MTNAELEVVEVAFDRPFRASDTKTSGVSTIATRLDADFRAVINSEFSEIRAPF